jgi:hypothetical protein
VRSGSWEHKLVVCVCAGQDAAVAPVQDEPQEASLAAEGAGGLATGGSKWDDASDDDGDVPRTKRAKKAAALGTEQASKRPKIDVCGLLLIGVSFAATVTCHGGFFCTDRHLGCCRSALFFLV